MGSGAVNDLEALEDQNQRLKVALSRLVEENKRYRVNKTRLEGELLRADAKVELLLSEFEQAPGKRDQRLLNAARMEVEKCAVVRSLAKQKENLQRMLAWQERELDAMKRTKEWSAVVEMTAATEEYFLEIRRLQRLLAQQQQQDALASAGDAFRVQVEVVTPAASATVMKHHRPGGDDGGDGVGSDAGSPGEAVAPRSSQRAGDEFESQHNCDNEGTSDNVYNEDTEGRLLSSVPSQESLTAAASVEYPSPKSSAKECEEDTTATTQTQGRNNEQTVDGSIQDRAGSGAEKSARKDKESGVAEEYELARSLIKPGPSWGSSEAVGEPPNDKTKEGNSEEGSVRSVSSRTSTVADAREMPNVDVVTGENSTSSTRNTKSSGGRERKVTAAKKTDGLPSDASPSSVSHGSSNDGENTSSSPLPEVRDDNSITRSVSSRAVTEKDYQTEIEADAELETDKLLFGIDGDGDSASDEPLIGENGAVPSEYGDDFDDFEDEED
eukprot:g12747.t1